MRKAYNLKKLTGQVRSFAALMLIMLMAVGSAFAYEVTYVFSEQSYGNTTTNFVTLTADGPVAINDYVSFTAAKGSPNSNPTYYSGNPGALRLYTKNGDGNSITFIPADGYQITGVSMTEVSSYKGKIGFVVDDADAVIVSPDNNNVCAISDVSAVTGLKCYNAETASSGNVRIVSVTITYEEAEAPAVVAPVISVPTGKYLTAQTVTLSCATAGADIFYALNEGEFIRYNNTPITVSENTTITAYAQLGEAQSANVTATYTFPVQVPNIAAFKNSTTGNFYHITGDVTYVYRNAENMYVQDATGALLVYDQSNIVTTQYEEGDVISGGIAGTYTNHNGTKEMIPTHNPAVSTTQETVVPVEVTVAQLLANPDKYISSLVKVKDVTFTQSHTFTTNSKTGVDVIQNGNTIKVWNQYKTLNTTVEEGDGANVVGLVALYNNVPQIYPRSNADITPSYVNVPYVCIFGNGDDFEEWSFANDNPNKWYIGTPQGFEGNELYISSSNGLTNKYNVSAASVSHAYIKANLPASDVGVVFRYRSMGEANDFLQVSVMDEAPVAGQLPENYLGRFYGKDDFTAGHVTIPASEAGMKYIVFTWNNDAAGGNQTPAILKYVAMMPVCSQVTNLTAVAEGRTATITWDAMEGQDAWELQYKDAEGEAWQTVNADEPTVTLNNLSTETTYDVRVRTQCGTGSSSEWANTQFTVPCIELTTSQEEITIGTGTSAGSYVPIGAYDANSWTQMIYPASEFSSTGFINDISWYVNAVNSHSYTDLIIYMGTTTMNSVTTTSWVPMEDLTKVYESHNGTLGNAVGWETYQLLSPYKYNKDNGNLVVVVSRKASAYKMVSYRYTSTPSPVSMRRGNDSNASYGDYPTASGTVYSYLPNMMVNFTSYVCGDEHCATPADLTVEDITTNSAVINWEAGEANAWQVSYKAEDAVQWTTVPVNEATYALSGLEQNTTYMVRVLADCGEIGMSHEAAATFTTVATCIAPQQVTAEASTYTVHVSWQPVEGVSNYEVHVEGVNNDYDLTFNVMNASQTDLTGLEENAQYKISVRSLCDEELISDWTTINFTMPTICAAPTGFAVTEVTPEAITLTWNAGTATNWIVEYGPAGFNHGEGTLLNVEENTVTLTDIVASTLYELYVKADCGLGFTSAWVGPLTAYTGQTVIMQKTGEQTITTCGAIIYDDGGPTAIYSNNCNSILVINPETEGAFIHVTGTSNTENNWDYLYIYDGVGTTGTLLGQYTNEQSVDVLSTGPVTIKFTSDGSGQRIGFELLAECVIVNCPAPRNVAVNDVTPTSAVVNWTAGGDETAWIIEYGPANFTPGEGQGTVVAADANPFTLSGLNGATNYDVYVQANCGNALSEYSSKATFATACVPMATPYTENFDSYTGSSYSSAGVVPTCWDNYIEGTYYPAPHVNTGGTYAQSGKGLTFVANTSSPNAYVFLPLFEKPINTMTLNFWRKMEGATQGTLTVGYVTDINDPANTYTVVTTVPSVTGSNAANYSVDFTQYNGTIPADARIAMRWYRTGVYYLCGIDNIEVTSTMDVACSSVTELAADNITYNSATLTWTPGADETAWTVAYKAVDAEEWNTVQATEPTIVLTGLSSMTEYEVSVAAVCGEEQSDATTATFTTICGNPCEYTINMHDSYGDGWNGAYIVASFSDGTSENIAITAGTYSNKIYDETIIVSIPEGETMTCNWHSGSYDGEASFEIINDCGETMYAKTGTTTPSANFFTAECPDPSPCVKPADLTVSGITGTSAIVSWTVGSDETVWVLEYKTADVDEWTATEVTTTTYPLTGLEAGTAYDVRVKAVCGEELSSKYASVSFSTCYDGCVYTFNLHDSYGDGWNGGYILASFSDGTSENITITAGTYYNKIYDETKIVTIPAGETMTLSWNSGSYDEEASFEILDPCGVEVYSQTDGSQFDDEDEFYSVQCAAITCPAPMALSATEVDETGTSVITWFPGGEETSWTLTMTSNYGAVVAQTVEEPTYTITGIEHGDAWDVAVKAVCGEGDESAEVTVSVVSPALVDIELVQVYTNPSNCDLSNVKAQITVANVLETPISSFEAYYQVNGQGPVVHQTFTPYFPLTEGQTWTVTFETAPVFDQATNFIEAWITIPSETNTENNRKVSGLTNHTNVQALPYVENFNSGAGLNWPVLDRNMDGSTFVIANNAIQYNGNDRYAANDWIVSPCVEYTPNADYLISFDYKANSSYYNEKFSAFFGPSANPVDDWMITSFNFNNTEYEHYDYIGRLVMPMENLHVAFKAESSIGTDGFSIDNVAIKKVVSMNVSAEDHGTFTVSNALLKNNIYWVGDGEAATIVIYPESGYHVEGIYVNNELVRGENPNNAAIDIFTFTPEAGDFVNIKFTGNPYTVDATVTNQHYTAYNNNAPGAAYVPAHEDVAAFGSHTGIITLAQYFHLVSITVNGANITENDDYVTNLGNGQYRVTLTNILENKDIQVVTEIDSTNIYYTIGSGNGTINNTFVVDGDETYPVYYTETIAAYSDFFSTFKPATGYHVASVVIDGVNHYNISEFQFVKLLGNHTVVVNFERNHYVITTNAAGNGTVTPGVEIDYNPDYTYTFMATPDAGYRITTILRNGELLEVETPALGYIEELTNILSDYNYEVVFAPNVYTVTATAGNNGTITPAGVTTFLYEQDAIYTVNAAEGYYIASLTIDGGTPTEYTQEDDLTTYTHTFPAIANDHTIAATFAQKMFTVTVNAGDHGTITPATDEYAYGATPTFVITPAPGYAIVDVTVDNVSVGIVDTFTFVQGLTADHTIAATFAKVDYTITATAGFGGSIDPDGVIAVAHGSNKTFNITADNGYMLSNLYVDGVAVTPANTYTFNNVTADHSIYAVFAQKEYTITVTQPANGTITPGTLTVQHGATPSFMIVPNAGDTVTAITVGTTNVIANAVNVNGVFTYTFPAVTENKTLTATIVAKKYTIAATAGANGSISPAGNAQVDHGTTKVYTITPNNGYVVENVTVDGMSMGALTTYIFTNVVANHTIHATFKMAECEVPSFLYVTHIDSTSAELHWSHPATGITFDIQYKTPEGSFTSVTAVSGNNYELTGLNPSTTYLWQVRANCSANNHSEWSNLISFRTANTIIDNTGIEDLVKNQIKVYAEHQNVHIINNEGMNIEQVRIFDVYGKMIYSGAVNSNHEVIGLNVATGTYVVNVATDKGTVNYKVMLMK